MFKKVSKQTIKKMKNRDNEVKVRALMLLLSKDMLYQLRPKKKFTLLEKKAFPWAQCFFLDVHIL